MSPMLELLYVNYQMLHSVQFLSIAMKCDFIMLVFTSLDQEV